MILRYSRKPMSDIWELNSKFQTYLDVELAICEAYNQIGKIPNEALKEIKQKASFSVERIDEIEAEVKHDVIAFLTCVNENIGPSSKYMHMGITSSDIIDTAMALQIQKASEIIEEDLKSVINTLRNKAKEHKNTICIGRSHGIHAEPMTFGVKLCYWIDLFEKALIRFNTAREDIRIGQISGPVGTYSNIPTEIEDIVCKKLNLKPAKISTQVISRDHHAYYMQSLALIGAIIEQCVTEIRHLQKTEVLEVEEGFSQGQKGSSAMPHKKNPINSENLTGLARLLKSNSIAAFDNIVLWHERDISHSSVERVIFPDSTILTDYMLNRFKNTIENLVVHKKNMLKNTSLYGGVIFSQRVLLKLTEKGLTREEAYTMTQRNALSAWNKPNGDFKSNLLNDNEIRKYLSELEIEECFNLQYYLRNINTIYKRFGI